MSGLVILCQFLFRLSLGMAAGMGATSPRRVTSGYFRNHLYVLMGLNASGHGSLQPPTPRISRRRFGRRCGCCNCQVMLARCAGL